MSLFFWISYNASSTPNDLSSNSLCVMAPEASNPLSSASTSSRPGSCGVVGADGMGGADGSADTPPMGW